MTHTAALTEPRLDADWLAARLAAAVTFFAARSDASDDDSEGRSEPGAADLAGRAEGLPGEPVDTSHHDEPQSPVASTGDQPGRRKAGKRSNRKRD